MKGKTFKLLSLLLIVVCLLALTFVGCKKTEKQYEITYNLNYDGASAPQTENLKEGAKITLVPERTGYTFDGWFKNAECTEPIGSDYTVTQKATLYAKWTKIVYEYWLGGSFNGYATPNSDDNYKMSLLSGSSTVYSITVSLTAEMRDPTYDGHWYKVSKGTWNATDLYGIEQYFIQPAPVKYTDSGDAIGLGAIWIDGNGSFTIIYDSVKNVIYDTYGTADTVRIYGDFNSETDRGPDWSILPGEALVLTDENEDGIWEGELTLPAYTGTGDGYQLNVLTRYGYDFYPNWHGYSVKEQFKFNGDAGGLGETSYLKPTYATTYRFYYNASTHKTDYTFDLAAPTLYGDFNNWNIFDGNTLMSKQENGTYTVSVTLPAYGGDGSGWSLILCVGAKYFSEWNSVGAGEQYIFDGTPATMGAASFIKNTEETTYLFTYDPATHKVTADKDYSFDLAAPTLYGDFNNWNIFDGNTLMSKQENGTYTVSVTLPAYEGDGNGWSLIVCVGAKYFSEYNVVGAGEQYTFDGTPATMGAASFIKNTEETTYLFTYDPATHKTTYAAQ